MDHDNWKSEWQELVIRLRREWSQVGRDQRQWFAQRLGEVVRLKRELNRLFVAADGAACCARCDGACCARGRHHMTLVEVLTALERGEDLPDPDPGATCPYLTAGGCSLAPELRPFNCVTFNCEQVENRLGPEEVDAFYRAERALRELYTEFEQRCAGASLRGLVIRARRLGDAPLLEPPGESG